MANPGYVLVAADGLDVTKNEAQTVDGLYERLEAALNTGKMVVLTGLVSGETPVSPAPITLVEGAGMSISMTQFTGVVTDDDEVTPVGG